MKRQKLTEQEHFNFISLHHLIPLELVLNLLVAGLALLILGTHSTTHFGGFLKVGMDMGDDKVAMTGKVKEGRGLDKRLSDVDCQQILRTRDSCDEAMVNVA